MTRRQKLCTFRLGGALHGVAVERVQEVVRELPITRVPLAPPALRGLINLRGEIVPAIDLRTCLGLPPHDAPSFNVVVHAGEGVVSLLVDDVGDVMDLDDRAFEPPPDNLRGVAREMIDGVYKIEGGLLAVLRLDNAIAAAATRRPRVHAPGRETEEER